MAKEAKVKGKPLKARNRFLREKKEQARKQAQERQAAYDALTVEQKLAKLDAGGFVATKQRAKLTAALATTKIVTPVEPPAPTPEVKKKEKKGHQARRQAKHDKKAG